MLYIAYSDIHIWPSWPEFNPITPSGRTRWLEIQLDVWRQINNYAKQYKVAAKLFAGDLVHKRSYIHTTANNSILDLYKNELECSEVMISGNHDRFDQNFNAVEALHGIGNARVLSPKLGEFTSFTEDCERVTIAGALPGGELPKLPTNCNYSILLAHGILNGANSASGFELEGGYNLKDFEGWNLVILGDIHKRQLKGNVLIPGAPLQMNWGDASLDFGCWLIDTKLDTIKFLPIKAPRFIVVTKENFDKEVVPKLQEGKVDDYNYYDFRFYEELDSEVVFELKRLFPQSYFTIKSKDALEIKPEMLFDQKTQTPEEILGRFHELKFKTDNRKQFIEKGMELLLTADPKQRTRGYKNLQILSIKAQNFLAFQNVEINLNDLPSQLYQVTGTSDDATSDTNGIGKSALATEILSYVLFDTMARSKTRSKDRLIHDPQHTGKGKGLFAQVEVQVGDQQYLVQRYRKHSELGTGSRILQKV